MEVRRETVPANPAANDTVPGVPADLARHPLLARRARRPATSAVEAPPDPPTQFDLMIVYTAAAREAAGGQEAIELLCETRTENCNLVYANSDLNLRARLVHTMETSYQQQGSFHADLNNFDDPVVTAALDQYGADFLSLVVDGASESDVADVAGIAVEGGSFNVCGVVNTPASVLAHELGHNMGCGHDRPNAVQFSPPSYPYSYGWSWTGSDGRLYGDVMSYVGDRTPFLFSNPRILYAGVPAGDAQADNARTILENAPDFCNNRRATVGARPLVFISLAQPEAIKETG